MAYTKTLYMVQESFYLLSTSSSKNQMNLKKFLLSIKMFYKNNVILLCMKRACICYISYAGSVPTAEGGQGH